MENYDDWKLKTPETKDKECKFCGEQSEKKYCSTECRKAYENEN